MSTDMNLWQNIFMNITFPIVELFDRYAIACVKWQRTKSNKDELEYYQKQVDQFDINLVSEPLESLTSIHNIIWDLEWQLKTGVEDQLPLAEIGRRAIAIRNFNNKRVAFKNEIAELLKDTVKEIKQDHLSE
jgi:hypothetical protein